jgi:hypothetical protein
MAVDGTINLTSRHSLHGFMSYLKVQPILLSWKTVVIL